MPFLVETVDGAEHQIPQSGAIVRQLARRHGLYGRDASEQSAADIAEDTAVDLYQAFTSLRFSPPWNDDAERAKFGAETAPIHLRRLAKLLGEREWFASNAPTFADLTAFEIVDQLRAIWPDMLEDHPTLAAFSARVRELPTIREYLAKR
jgi:glutathione S-transferase